MADLVGKHLGNYHLLRYVGQGGFADVYLGEHRYLKTKAAIKVMHARMSKEDLDVFLKEAQTIAGLKHPHIVPIHDFSQENNTPFLVMEFAAQGTLRQRHPKGSILPGTTILSYVKQIAAALQYAHDQKVIHLDIKPENMLVNNNGDILLSDFGIAVIAHNTSSLKTQLPSGTPLYMAPEQWNGRPRPASDQYALGVVVFEWLNGTPPFHGNNHALPYQHQTATPAFNRTLHIPVPVESVVLRALAKDPGKRFPNVESFALVLEQAMQAALGSYSQPHIPNLPIMQPSSPPGPQNQPIPPTIPADVRNTPPSTILSSQPAAKLNLDSLYREGIKARTQGNLEQAVSLWQRVLDRNPNYGNGLLAQQMKELLQLHCDALYEAGIKARTQGNLNQAASLWQQVLDKNPDYVNYKLARKYEDLRRQIDDVRAEEQRALAKVAYREARWDDEIHAWSQLLQIKPRDTEAEERLSIAKHNQQNAWMYENARQFIAEGDLSSAKQQLTTLWQGAPYYSDPLDLATSVQMPKHSESATRRRQSRDGLDGGTGTIYFYILCLLGGLGSTVGFIINIASHEGKLITPSIWAVTTVILVALISYISGYHKVINLLPMVCMTVVGIGVAWGGTWFTSTLPYTTYFGNGSLRSGYQTVNDIFLLGSRTIQLTGQEVMGLVLAIIFSLIIGVIGAFYKSEEDNTIISILIGSGYGLVGYFCLWLISAFLGLLFNWPFGFFVGWYISLFYGLVLSIVNGCGVVSLFISIFEIWPKSSNSLHR